MNSLESACSFAKCTPMAFHQFEQQIQPRLGGEVRVELVVGAVRLVKAVKDSDGSVHDRTLASLFWSYSASVAMIRSTTAS